MKRTEQVRWPHGLAILQALFDGRTQQLIGKGFLAKLQFLFQSLLRNQLIHAATYRPNPVAQTVAALLKHHEKTDYKSQRLNLLGFPLSEATLNSYLINWKFADFTRNLIYINIHFSSCLGELVCVQQT